MKPAWQNAPLTRSKDLSKTRDIVARNADGTIPTPRIFSTNWTWDRFWPKEVGTVEHNTAINRRDVFGHNREPM